MKKVLLAVVVVALAVGGIVWYEKHGKATASGDESGGKKADDEGEGPQVARDANGNAVISMSDDAQGEMGIKVEKPAVTNISPELKGYGRVLDPAPLASAIGEVAVAEAAYKASSNELARVQLLAGQGNASSRAAQTAEAAALKDQLAAQAAKDRFILTWGKALATQENMPSFLQSLTSREAALVRIDLAAGESPTNQPNGARITALTGNSVEASYLAPTPSVDPQLQGRGFFFLIRTNLAELAPGQSVVGYLQLPGEPITGVVVPRGAVVRTEGAGWVYVLNSDGEGFTRVEVPLDHAVEAGWFVTKRVTGESYVVTTGAQQLLSIEQKGKGE